MTARTGGATIGAMPRIIAAILATVALVLDDTPNWLLLIGLTVSMTLALGFKGRRQRRRSR